MEENNKLETIQTVKYPLGRKSLAVDLDTYNMLQEICDVQRRSKIDQLKVLIETAHDQLVVADTNY
jgi:hypothetical protein|tara:strand:+ start:735 stop:932 length:198 start_codon:yes stop_codon:yes gene_type:complete